MVIRLITSLSFLKCIRSYLILTGLFLFIIHEVKGQEPLCTLSGRITDTLGGPLPGVHVYLEQNNKGVISDGEGNYIIYFPSSDIVKVNFSFLGYEKFSHTFIRPSGTIAYHVVLTPQTLSLKEVKISTAGKDIDNFSRLTIQEIQKIPTLSGSIESAIQLLPGVSVNSELSSQYSVRGGNFDENLVYINGVEIYRPTLIHSGNQEGMGIIHPKLVSSVKFSSGGFAAQYGDKMSSVLDITYKKPTQFHSTASVGLMGVSLHSEGTLLKNKGQYLAGFRYRNHAYLLQSLETKGEYNPAFMDFQILSTFEIHKHIELGYLGIFTSNAYDFVPETRTTSFGTLEAPLNFTVFYDGQEKDQYLAYNQAIYTDINIEKWKNRFQYANFYTREKEFYDILGEYYLSSIDPVTDRENPEEESLLIGAGGNLEHARNRFSAQVHNFTYSGTYIFNDKWLKWGISYSREHIEDILKEWELKDSTGFSIPYNGDDISLYSVNNWNSNRNQDRISSFVQFTYPFYILSGKLTVNGGIRLAYLDINDEWLTSPRGILTYLPDRNKQLSFHLAAGLYYQPPFVKELRELSPQEILEIRSQQSFHIDLGGTYQFTAWGRPFQFTTEVFYKDLQYLIPYKRENLRLIYSGKNNASGYAAGIDMRINGEFVEGAESWASLSLLNTKEDIENDTYEDENENIIPIGPYPRPTSQWLKIGVFFQDYLPNNPTYKVYLSLFFGTRVPGSNPRPDRFDSDYYIPSYRRVDLGLSKVIKSKNREPGKNPFWNTFESIWLDVEVFNLLDIRNTISYSWISTIPNSANTERQYAIPNYLTGRRINAKFTVSF